MTVMTKTGSTAPTQTNCIHQVFCSVELLKWDQIPFLFKDTVGCVIMIFTPTWAQEFNEDAA